MMIRDIELPVDVPTLRDPENRFAGFEECSQAIKKGGELVLHY